LSRSSAGRGPLPESRHRGALAVANAEGLALLRLGNVDSPVYPRSAVKALQAIALMESGAADALGLTDAEIALACASHNGEPPHVAAARAVLAKAGFDETDLECGAHPPRLEGGVAARHISRTPPSAIHNNCSGKHAGMLALARHMGSSRPATATRITRSRWQCGASWRR
jgi:L-asparaginase II